MNKGDLVTTVAEKTGLGKAEAEKAVDAVFDGIAAALKDGDDVRLPGFGSFSVAAREAREGRNPRTGEAITIAAAMTPKFSPGKGLKEAVNG